MFHLLIDKGRVCSSGLSTGSNFKFYNAGEIFEPDNYNVDNLFIDLSSGNFENLKSLIGEFIYLIEDDENVYVVVDEVGTINWYYYCDDDRFMVSNNFWRIVEVVKPNIGDVDKDVVYEQTLMVKTFGGKTFIKKINVIEGGKLLVYNKRTRDLFYENYTDIEYIEDAGLVHKEQVFIKLDSLFKKTIGKIKKHNSGCRFGVTISGGLDSRFPLPFLGNGDVSMAYLIGLKNMFAVDPYDLLSAKKLAKMFRFPFKMISPFDLKIKDKIWIDIVRNPTKDSDIMKAIDYDESFKGDPFDVLITGAYGGMIGGQKLNSDLLKENSARKIALEIFYDYSLYRDIQKCRAQRSWLETKYRKILWYLNKIFKTSIFLYSPTRKEYVERYLNDNFLFPSTEKKNVVNKIEDYVQSEQSKNKNILSVVMKNHVFGHCMLGSFESLHGQVKAYSVYHPYIYHFSKTWPVKFLQDRNIMEEYLIDRFQDMSKIPTQRNGLSVFEKYQNLSNGKRRYLKFKNSFLFRTRGLTINYTKWFLNKDLQKEFKKCFKNKYRFFYEIFNEKDVMHLIRYKKYTHFIENLFKMKMLIDIVESGQYEGILERDSYSESTKF